MTLDDALKAVPGFTLFRRTSSRVSNPTAQGITLRGLGGTGVEPVAGPGRRRAAQRRVRRLGLLGQAAASAIDRVEVLRGSGSDLYGADAVGGVVQVLTWHPSRPVRLARSSRAAVSAPAACRCSPAAEPTAGRTAPAASGSRPTATSRSRPTQDPGIAPRGPIDTNSTSAHRSGLASLGYHAENGWRFEASGNVFSEDRGNGTPAVINSTAARYVSGEAAGGTGRRAVLGADLWRHAGLRSDVLGGLGRPDERGSQPPAVRADARRRRRAVNGSGRLDATPFSSAPKASSSGARPTRRNWRAGA